MDENTIKRIAEQVFVEKMNTNQFRVSAIPYHVHNGTDAPLIDSSANASSSNTSVAYFGYCSAIGTAGTPFPSGWSVSSDGSGKSTVTHNLGHTNYSVVCTGDGAISIPSIQSIGTNTFVVWWYSTVASLQSTAYHFVLVTE